MSKKIIKFLLGIFFLLLALLICFGFVYIAILAGRAGVG